MLNLILTDAATRMDEQDAQDQYFRDRCGRLEAECKKRGDVTETHLAVDDVPMILRVYANDGVDENDLRHRITEIAETLKIVVDGNMG
jgi:hypothetical protein